MKIDSFRGDYFFLSNFCMVSFEYKGFQYRSVEHAYQALKATNKEDHDKVANSKKAGEAKRWGKNIEMKFDWEKTKEDVMYEVIKAKFSQNFGLKKMLIDTGDAELIEGNNWGDIYWGFDTRQKRGQNKLGKILMKVRNELKSEESKSRETENIL